MSTVASLLNAMRERSARRRPVRELRALPDELLRDMGIARGEIESVVAEGGRTRGR